MVPHPPTARPRPRHRTKRWRTPRWRMMELRKKESRKVTEGGQWRRKEEQPPAILARKFCYPGKHRYVYIILYINNSKLLSSNVLHSLAIFYILGLYILLKVTTRKEPKQLVEEIEETKEYVAGDAERKRFGTKILDDQRCSDDLPGGYSVGRELAHYEKLVLETTNETEITPPCCKQGKNDDSKLHTNSEYDYRDKKHLVESHKTFRGCSPCLSPFDSISEILRVTNRHKFLQIMLDMFEIGKQWINSKFIPICFVFLCIAYILCIFALLNFP